MTRQSQLTAQSTTDNDQPSKQHINVHSPKTTRARRKTLTQICHQVQEWPIPLMLPDAQEGPEAVMAAIYGWFAYQEQLKLFFPMGGKDKTYLDKTVPPNIQTGSNLTLVLFMNQPQVTTQREEQSSREELQQLKHPLTLMSKKQLTLMGITNCRHQYKTQTNKP